jgi:hypothetical protein
MNLNLKAFTKAQKTSCDIIFNNELNSSSKGFSITAKECIDYIKMYNGTSESYFKDYKGGLVEVVSRLDGTIIYTQIVK